MGDRGSGLPFDEPVPLVIDTRVEGVTLAEWIDNRILPLRDMSDETRRAQEPEEDPQKIATGMTLADISIRNHVFAWILMFALIGFGLLCFTGFGTVFKGLGVSQNPDVDFPVVSISV